MNDLGRIEDLPAEYVDEMRYYRHVINPKTQQVDLEELSRMSDER